jgi:hypothetical protein
MEQRVGRIDRVRSQTHRRLEELDRPPKEEEKLQVFYPHLRETAEAYQVQTVLERLNRFLVLMHKDLKAPELDQRQLNLRQEVANGLRDVRAITQPLATAFPVPEGYIGSELIAMDVGPEFAEQIEAQFDTATAALSSGSSVTWIEQRAGVRVGTLRIGERIQAFSLFLRSVDGLPVVRCVSPIGTKDEALSVDALALAFSVPGVRVCAVYNQSLVGYEFAVEGDVLLWPGADGVKRTRELVSCVVEAADALEARLLDVDPSPEQFTTDLSEEPGYAR